MSNRVQDHFGDTIKFDTPNDGTNFGIAAHNRVWDTSLLMWVSETQPGGSSGGGAATIANGADVAEGSTNDTAWTSGAGTVISLLKKIASAGGGAVSIADGSDTAEGSTTDAAVITDVNSTISGKVRGIVKMLSSVWDGTNTIRMSGTMGVTGTVGISSLPSTPAGTNTIGYTGVFGTVGVTGTTGVTGTLGISSLPSTPAGTNAIGAVIATGTMALSGTSTVLNAAGTNAMGSVVVTAGTMAVSSLPSTPAGTNAIGNVVVTSGTMAVSALPATPAGTNAIGSVTVTALPSTPAGTNAIGNVIATGTVNVLPPALTKAAQGTSGFSVQNLCDAGRTYLTFVADRVACSTAEALLSLVINKGGVLSTSTAYAVSAGKTLRLQQMNSTMLSTTTTGIYGRARIRSAGTAVATSPIVTGIDTPMPPGTVAAGVGIALGITFPDGIEIAAAQQIGVSHIENSAAGTVSVVVNGFEY